MGIENGGVSLFTGDKRVLHEGMSFHILPHIAIPEFGTIGYSRTVLCTSSSAEPLTDVPVDLLS